MALSKVNFNSLNLTPTASKTVVFNSNNNGIEAGDVGGSMVLISSQTASSSATIDFTSGIDSTYKEYIFKFIDIHPASDGPTFTFQVDTGTNTNYNQTITSSFVFVQHGEDAGSAGLDYSTSYDSTQATAFKSLTSTQGNGNDECCCGTLHLFDPSSSTFVKNFLADMQQYYNGDDSVRLLTGGYFNTTTALTRVRFKMDSGNIDAGTIKMYGVT